MDENRLRRLGVDLVLVFGSQARGQATASSDVDVGVLLTPNAEQSFEAVEEIREALAADASVDLVLLNTADPLLLKYAALEGEILFEARDGAAEEFRLRAVKRFMDTAKFRKREAEALRSHYG